MGADGLRGKGRGWPPPGGDVRTASVASTRSHWPQKTASSTIEAPVKEGPHLDHDTGPGLPEQFPGDGQCRVEVAGLERELAAEVLLSELM